MKIPEKVRLSIDLVHHLRHLPDANPRRVEDLAVVLGTTKNFLHQVVCHLSKAGMVSVVKGPRGGILANLKQTSVLEVYNLFGYMTEPVTGTGHSATVEREARDFLGSCFL